MCEHEAQVRTCHSTVQDLRQKRLCLSIFEGLIGNNYE